MSRPDRVGPCLHVKCVRSGYFHVRSRFFGFGLDFGSKIMDRGFYTYVALFGLGFFIQVGLGFFGRVGRAMLD